MNIHESWIKWLNLLQKKYGIEKGNELFKDFCLILGDVLKFHYDEVEFEFDIQKMQVNYHINRDEEALIDLEDLLIR